MDIRFVHSQNRWDQTLVTRSDGVRLTVPVFGPMEPMPHDLLHFLVESELELPDGFWGSVAAGAIFEGMHVVGGRQHPHAGERSRAVMKAHHQGILFAEGVVGDLHEALHGTPEPQVPLWIESPHVPSRTTSDRRALIVQLLRTAEELRFRWERIPLGETLLVQWPDRLARQSSPRHSRRQVAARR
jgi:hypothetical protein